MKQTEIAHRLGVSKAYISMVMNGKKQPSQRVAEELTKLGIVNQFEANKGNPKSCSSANSDTSPMQNLLPLNNSILPNLP